MLSTVYNSLQLIVGHALQSDSCPQFQQSRSGGEARHLEMLCRTTEFAPDRVKPALLGTLRDLQLEYLDLYLVSQNLPSNNKPPNSIRENRSQCACSHDILQVTDSHRTTLLLTCPLQVGWCEAASSQIANPLLSMNAGRPAITLKHFTGCSAVFSGIRAISPHPPHLPALFPALGP